MERKAPLIILGFLISAICINTPQVFAAAVTVAAGSNNGYVYVYDGDGNDLWNYYTGADVASVAVSSDGKYIAVGSLENKLYLFRRHGTKLWEKSVPISYGGNWKGEESKTVAISAHGEYVVAGCTDNLYVYKRDGTLHWSHAGKETCVGISPNGTYIVSCNKPGGTMHLFSISSSDPLWSKGIFVFWVAISDLGYVAGDSAKTVCLWDNAGTQKWNYMHPKWEQGSYKRVDISQDGSSVVAVNDDPWDSAGCVLTYFNHLKDGTPGWSVGDGIPSWTYVPSPDDPDNDYYTVAISADGEIIATGPAQGTVVLSRTGTLLQKFTSPPTQSIDLTSNGEFGAYGDSNGKVWFFSKDSSTPLWSKTMGGNVHTVALATVAPSEVPALTNWGLLVLFLLLMASAIYVMYQRKRGVVPR